MRAFVRVTGVDQTVVEADVEIPNPGPGEVLVAVRAFGVGIHDRSFVPPEGPFPYTIGIEGAGVVDRRGDGVSDIDVGARVMVSAPMARTGGTWAEYVAVDRAGITPIPDALSFEVAAGVPVAGRTAIDSLHALAVQSGDNLFVAGASGAIGTLVVQLAVARGVRVIGSASAVNHDHLRSLGAAAAVDYHDGAWPNQVRQWAPGGVDAALAIQPGTGVAVQTVVRDGGRLVTVSGDAASIAAERNISIEQFTHRGDGANSDMEQLVGDLVSGRIRLVLEQVFAFDEALRALEKTETRHARGKLVVLAPS